MTTTTNLISTDRFDWDRETATFSIEASDLGDQMAAPILGLQSARTGRIIECEVVATKCDNEGELTHWIWRPINLPERDLFRVVIFND